MRKLSVIILFAVACLAGGNASAQMQQRTNALKQKMKTQLNIDDAKADSVIRIVEQNFTNARAIRTGPMDEAQKKTALQNARKEEMARLRSFLDKDQMTKLQQLVQEYRQERQTRRGGADSTSGHQ